MRVRSRRQKTGDRRGLEGWRIGKSEGFKESRIRGVERRKAEDRIQKSEVRRQEKVGGLATYPHFQTYKLLQNGVICFQS